MPSMKIALAGAGPDAETQPSSTEATPRIRALADLRAGELVELTGRVLSLRDASAARLAAALGAGQSPPVPLAGQIMYAVGPSPAQPGRIIGSAGPTTTARMARFLPALFGSGVAAVIGKGELHGDDMAAFVRTGSVYLAATGGAGALLARRITSASVVAYEDLGPEALFALDLDAFPAVVVIDRTGRNFHEEARARWRI
jgi:fumarate hydratase subunit beta